MPSKCQSPAEVLLGLHAVAGPGSGAAGAWGDVCTGPSAAGQQRLQQVHLQERRKEKEGKRGQAGGRKWKVQTSCGSLSAGSHAVHADTRGISMWYGLPKKPTKASPPS